MPCRDTSTTAEAWRPRPTALSSRATSTCIRGGSRGGVGGIRVLYPRGDGLFYIGAAACKKALSQCRAGRGWRRGGGSGDQPPLIDRFNPGVAAWIGFIGFPPSWQGSYAYRYGT